ncbi:GNAT family N-acetyltransferase [Nocardioides sp. GXQ0305]|uniref:GNAT family N-acetyltransferase n=1 Tax=Nocardioides sp. GXQ0305 TaxID=3423912 RepID=UPI003D7CB8FE
MRVPAETPVLRTERVVLRPLRPSDVDERRALGNDPEILQMFGVRPEFSEPAPVSEEESQEWYDDLAGDPNPLLWAIEHEGRFVGTTSLHSLREDDAKAQLGIGLLDRRCWGRGLGQEVTQEVVRFGFEEVGLHRIGLKVFAHNERAIRCYARCGFVEEGREREAAHVGGAWRDDVIMGILATDLCPPGR